VPKTLRFRKHDESYYDVTPPGIEPELWSRTRLFSYLVMAGIEPEHAVAYLLRAESAEVELVLPVLRPI
jgi:hypothetical protein